MLKDLSRFSILMALAFGLCSCNSDKDDEQKSTKGDSEGRQMTYLKPDDIEVRDNGLAFLKGEEEPYTGPIMQRDKSRTLRYFGYYMEGQLHGSEMRWYPSRALRRSYDYERGEKIRHREWFENGNQKKDAMMKNNEAYGRHLMWFEDGRKRFEGNFIEDLMWHGRIKDWKEDGTVLWDAIFEKGKYVSGIYPESEKQRLIDQGLLDPE